MKTAQRDEIAALLFGLTDKSVEFRIKWRSIAIAAIWLIMSGLTMVLYIFSVQENLHRAIIIGISFVKYIPLLFVVYNLSKKNGGKIS